MTDVFPAPRTCSPAASPKSWRLQIPSAGLLHELLQFNGKDARKFALLVERQLKNRAKLGISGPLGPLDNVRKLAVADIQSGEFGALAAESLLQQKLVASCRLLSSVCLFGGKQNADFPILSNTRPFARSWRRNRLRSREPYTKT